MHVEFIGSLILACLLAPAWALATERLTRAKQQGWAGWISALLLLGICVRVVNGQTVDSLTWMSVDYVKCEQGRHSECVRAFSEGLAWRILPRDRQDPNARVQMVLLLKDPFTPDPEYDIAVLRERSAPPNSRESQDHQRPATRGAETVWRLVRREYHLTAHRTGMPVPGSYVRTTVFEIAPGGESHALAWCGNVLLPLAASDIAAGEAVAFSCALMGSPVEPGATLRLVVTTVFPDAERMLDAGTVPGAVNSLRTPRSDQPFPLLLTSSSHAAHWRKQLRARTWEVIALDGGAGGHTGPMSGPNNQISRRNQR